MEREQQNDPDTEFCQSVYERIQNNLGVEVEIGDILRLMNDAQVAEYLEVVRTSGIKDYQKKIKIAIEIRLNMNR